MERVLVEMPPPHEAEHGDHVRLHALTTQSTGHACVLHACVCSSAGQAAPPLAAAVTTERVLVETPPPHEAEQGDHVRLHALTTQSTGHGCVLHAMVCCNA